jgi:type II secretory pathway pseudopilin PulG
MLVGKKEKNENSGISLIALIITIIVIIILAVIVIGNGTNTPEKATIARFVNDLAEIEGAVAIKRAENLMPTINNIEADTNAGFTKITFKRTLTSPSEDGWVVNLDTIKIKNSTLGNEYDEVVEDSEIVLGDTAPDIYVYDTNGAVYYARGQKSSGKTIFSRNEITSDDENDSTVEAENPDDWEFDEDTGTITKYLGPNVETLIIPNSINGVRVKELVGDSYYGGIIDYSSNIPNVIISPGIEIIGDSAFCWNVNIQNITIGSSVTTIRGQAFAGCNGLTSITIPSNVITIESYFLSECENILSINVDPENPSYKSVNGVLYNKQGTVLCRYPVAKTDKNYVIPDGVTRIDDAAFSKCNDIENITIPNTVTSIGGWAFCVCVNLLNVNIPNGVEVIENDTFSGCIKLGEITIPDSVTRISYNSFSGCKGLSSIELPEGITAIEYGSFSGCSGLNSVNIPYGVTRINSYAFSNCSGLTEAVIPNTVTDIDPYAFWGCSELTSITIPSSVTFIAQNVFQSCTKLANIIVEKSSLDGAPWGAPSAIVTFNP